MKVVISDQAYNAVEHAATNLFVDRGVRQKDGKWSIQLNDQTYERLKDAQMQGESISDTIIRLCAALEHQGRHIN